VEVPRRLGLVEIAPEIGPGGGCGFRIREFLVCFDIDTAKFKVRYGNSAEYALRGVGRILFVGRNGD